MRLSLLSGAALAAGIATAAVAQPSNPPPPRLVVAIAVDQFSADLFDEYRPQFRGGLARIASGSAYRNGFQSHAATETCPGHSTILTGARPARTGIVANNWFDQSVARKDKSVYCVEDESVPGSSSTKYTVSPDHLLVPTLGEYLKRARPGSRNVAVAGKDRAAVMMTGHVVDQRWYWNLNKFSTDQANAAVPAAVSRANQVIAAALAENRPPLEPPAFCASKDRAIPVQGRDEPVGQGRFARGAGDSTGFRASPELDGATLAVAAALVDEMQLGQRADPDVLAISLSATDYVGHSYGTGGMEMCLQMFALDRELGDFLSFLDQRGIDYEVALTADHGGQDLPERRRLEGVADAARTDAALSAGAIGESLVKRLGLSGFGLLGEGSAGDMYVDRSLPAADRKKLLANAVAAFRAHPQVEAVFTAEQLAATPMPTGDPRGWSLIQRARASYHAGRSGDFVVLLKKDITPIPDPSRYVATHGSVWDYDRRVPILFWRKGMVPADRSEAIETVDIMPTLAASIGLLIDPAAVDGKCLAGSGLTDCARR